MLERCLRNTVLNQVVAYMQKSVETTEEVEVFDINFSTNEKLEILHQQIVFFQNTKSQNFQRLQTRFKTLQNSDENQNLSLSPRWLLIIYKWLVSIRFCAWALKNYFHLLCSLLLDNWPLGEYCEYCKNHFTEIWVFQIGKLYIKIS